MTLIVTYCQQWTRLARIFYATIALVDNANFDGKPLPAHDGSWGGFDKLYAQHIAEIFSQSGRVD